MNSDIIIQKFYKSDEFYSAMNNFKLKCEEFGLGVEWINERIGLAYGLERLVIKLGYGENNIPLYRLDTSVQISTPNLVEFMSQVSSLFFERLEHER
jgi:hypothetical protein